MLTYTYTYIINVYTIHLSDYYVIKKIRPELIISVGGIVSSRKLNISKTLFVFVPTNEYLLNLSIV